eukprot:CAMPEP_0117649606 /NCGR_PEP_ID=MMETSP0804-20121206/1066_1 /TAXON_ID=1074897 /ORGANISM="Tetraselmis astigmatica, Strain CCMP880" /LENGTH=390 /DNA_ID=CAMNT_0005455363 /DNA_START=133 /DNA_END=1303 /DNA_ORIENTATION=+
MGRGAKGTSMLSSLWPGKRATAKPEGANRDPDSREHPEAWSDQPPAWLKGAVYKPNHKVGKKIPIAWDGTATKGMGNTGGTIGSTQNTGTTGQEGGGGMGAFLGRMGGGQGNQVRPAHTTRKLRSTLELPEGQIQIMVDPEAARIWGALREVLLNGEEDLVALFRQELAVLQIRNPGLLNSDELCALLNDLSHVNLVALPRQRAVLALQKILLTMQELSDQSRYLFNAEGIPIDTSGLPEKMLPDISIYLQDYKAMVDEAHARAQHAIHRAEQAEQALQNAKLPSESSLRFSNASIASRPVVAGPVDNSDIRRAELQLSALEDEALQKRRLYEDLLARIEKTKNEIQELDALLKAGTKESEALLRQLLQRSNNAAVTVGLADGDGGSGQG